MPLDVESTFDLIHEPWIAVRDLDGRRQELGILRTLGLAHQLAGLSGDVPTQTFALTRLLLAVLHGALQGPTDDDAWAELWEAEKLPIGAVAQYLSAHRDRFDLFHPETPFLQVAGLHTASGKTTGTVALIADVPNNIKFFTTRLGTDYSLTYAEAARWLVHCQAFDFSGIKTGAVGDSRVKGGKGYPIGVAWCGHLGGVLLEGSTLKETLLLNLMACDFPDYPRVPATDRPVWERSPVTAAEEQEGGRPPTGPVDLYTWQSRRIRLIPDGQGRVRDALVCNGEALTPQNKQGREPHTAWRRSPAQEKKLGRPLVYMPREHDPDRAIWRGLQSLLPGTSSRQRAEGAPSLAPGIMEWLSHLALDELIDNERTVQVRTIGMIYGAQSSVTEDVIDDSLALRAILARQDAEWLAQIAVACVEAADHAATALGNLAGDLAAAAGGDGTGPRSRAKEIAYAQLDRPYRDWLRGLGSDSDATAVQGHWHTTAWRIIQAAGRGLLANASPACWEGRVVRGRVLTAAHAADRFASALYEALPYGRPAAPNDAGETTATDAADSSEAQDKAASLPESARR